MANLKIAGENGNAGMRTGGTSRVIRLNNAATTPPFESTLRKVNSFLMTYGAMHRGSGPNASRTCEAVEQSIKIIERFLGIAAGQTLLFTQNTSSAINLFARLLNLRTQDAVIISGLEHTSNHLPWKYNTPARLIKARCFEDGAIDLEDLEKRIKIHRGQLKVVAITGASNLSGYVPPIKKIAKITHRAGAMLFIDAAQLAPHQPINMREQGIDALAFSAHKIYAPFGLGILALPKSMLERAPADPGGGSIDMISDDRIIWSPAAVRHQTGTWNVTGIVALAESCRVILEYGWPKILANEAALAKYAAATLSGIRGIKLYVPAEKYSGENRIGVFPFNIAGVHHAETSAILEAEYGIETRAGTICNHFLVRRWFGINSREQAAVEKEIMAGNRLSSYGVVRASLGIHNTKKDIDALAEALENISSRKLKFMYAPVLEKEIYAPTGNVKNTSFRPEPISKVPRRHF